ncbi:NAD(P)-binding domain-containing protein [Pseudonocardia halophobica]|uniref:NAD(P)-binding domain-containing protein n=1 Tax=Pseudonocardia halophobica TaxID=29401 RepID=UPI003D8EB71E
MKDPRSTVARKQRSWCNVTTAHPLLPPGRREARYPSSTHGSSHVTAGALGTTSAGGEGQPWFVWDSSVSAAWAGWCAGAWREPVGVRVVDSPVTGAVDGARSGRLTLFVGGDPGAV